MEMDEKIVWMLDHVTKFLLGKNEQYGDSVMQPLRIFSRVDRMEQIRVRIDDKLSRLARGNDDMEMDEDVILDLIGYLTFLLINMREIQE